MDAAMSLDGSLDMSIDSISGYSDTDGDSFVAGTTTELTQRQKDDLAVNEAIGTLEPILFEVVPMSQLHTLQKQTLHHACHILLLHRQTTMKS